MARKATKRGLTMVQISRMKKSASSTVHMPQIIKDRLALLADHQRSGQGVSEYILENLVIPHLEQLEAETKIKQKIFELTGNG